MEPFLTDRQNQARRRREEALAIADEEQALVLAEEEREETMDRKNGQNNLDGQKKSA